MKVAVIGGLRHYSMDHASTMCMARLPRLPDYDEGYATCFRCITWWIFYERAYQQLRERKARQQQ